MGPSTSFRNAANLRWLAFILLESFLALFKRHASNDRSGDLVDFRLEPHVFYGLVSLVFLLALYNERLLVELFVSFVTEATGLALYFAIDFLASELLTIYIGLIFGLKEH